MGPEETREVKRISGNFREDVSTQPLQRCSKEGVEHFIAREASSYKVQNIGTIHNSIAKKSIDADLKNEKKEIVQGIDDYDVEDSSHETYRSDISFSKIKELLVTQLSKWCFQTSNSGELISFCAKSPLVKMELFINFKNNGDSSHICLGPNFGYIQPGNLSNLKTKLKKVYSKITEDLEKKELMYEYTQFGNTHRLERIKQEDPEQWNVLKKSALEEFLRVEEVSFFEKILNFLELNSAKEGLSIYHILIEDTLNDNTVTNYFLDNIKIDVKQVYA